MEFQLWDQDSFVERCLFYWSRVYFRQLPEGHNYGELTPVISVIVTDIKSPALIAKGLETLAAEYHDSFSIRSNRTDKLLSNHFQMHFVQLPEEINSETLAKVHPLLAKWLAFLGYPNKTTEDLMESIAKEDSNVRSALDSYRNFHMDPDLRRIAEGRENFRRDVQAHVQMKEKASEARGKIEDAIETLLQLIEWNIAPPSDELRFRIEQMSKLEQIKSLYEMVGKRQVTTIEELTKNLL